jgi:hypothetical protein
MFALANGARNEIRVHHNSKLASRRRQHCDDAIGDLVLLDSRHSNQHEAYASGIENCAHLLEAGNFQTIGFINQYETRGITHGALSNRLLAAHLSERWLQGRQLFS